MNLRQTPAYRQRLNAMPYRNMSCAEYDTCLTRAAVHSKLDLGCSTCKDRKNASRHTVAAQEPSEKPAKKVLGSRDAANLLGIKLDRLNELRRQGKGPVSQINAATGKPEYRITNLKQFLETDRADAEIVTTPTAAALLGMSSRKLRTLRDNGGGPPFTRSGKFCQYLIKDIKTYRTRLKKEA